MLAAVHQLFQLCGAADAADEVNPLRGPWVIDAEHGGQQAILADARGETQKVRITNHLTEVIRQELSNPEGYKNASRGFIQILNNI